MVTDDAIAASDKADAALAVAESGALHLAALVRPDGRFVYRYTPQGRETGSYNLLRHCGTVWSMCSVAPHRPHLDTVVHRAKFALDWLLQSRVRRYKDGLCVISKGNMAKLGGAGLAVLACAAVAKAINDPTYLDTAEEFGRFILGRRRPDGDFAHKLVLDTGRVTGFRSDYYTGEALFALAILQKCRPDAAWEAALSDSLSQLSDRDYGVPQQSHWMMYALAEAAPILGPRVHLDYAARIARHIIEHKGYRQRRMSTPIACRTEALMAFLGFLDMAGAQDHLLVSEAFEDVERNLQLQLEWRHPNGGFAKGDHLPQVQIDYVQHNISAFLAYGLHLVRHSWRSLEN